MKPCLVRSIEFSLVNSCCSCLLAFVICVNGSKDTLSGEFNCKFPAA